MEPVTDVPESFAQSAEGDQVNNDYDSFAEAYSAENENSLVNAYYERPAMLALAGDVAGRRILDAGCGAGPWRIHYATVARPSPGSTRASRCWRWPGGGSVTT